MPIPYKMEIFSPEFDFRGGVAISDPEISFDYLSLDKISLTVPAISAEKGDYVHITNYMGGIVFQGIAADVSSDKYTTTISISPLLSILDVKAHFNRDDLSTVSLESFIADIITGLYIANDDDLQNITGLSVVVNSNTYSTTIGLENNVAELYTIITSALSAYGIVVSAEIDPQAKTFNISIGMVEDSVVIEADLKNVIERNFVIGDSYGAVNKITFINQDDETQQVTYYLHTDGTVSTNDEDRVTPVFASIEYIGGSKFGEDAANRAIKTLSPQQYNNLIELTYAINDKIINLETIAIGTQAYIKKGSSIYRSVYTGYEKIAETIKLVFGIVRVDLTKKLILDKRSRGNSLSIASSGGGEAGFSGWIPVTGAVSYNSVDDPTGVINVPSGHGIEEGNRLKLYNNGNVIYGIVTATTTTTITFLHEIDPTDNLALHLIATGDITEVYYSRDPAPQGFPVSPGKWEIVVTSASNQQVSSPTTSYKQAGNLQISVPIGEWELSMKGVSGVTLNTSGDVGCKFALSSSDISSTHSDLHGFSYFAAFGTSGLRQYFPPFYVRSMRPVKLTTKTTFYAVMAGFQTAPANLGMRGDYSPTYIKAQCAYL